MSSRRSLRSTTLTMLERVSRKSLTERLTSVKVVVVLAVPLKEDAVAEAVVKVLVDVDAVAKVAVVKVVDNVDPVPHRSTRTVTQLMLTEPRKVVIDRNIRVRLVRKDTLRIDVKDMSLDVETARVATEEVPGVISASPIRRKLREKPPLLRLRRMRKRKKRPRTRKKLPTLRRKLRNQLRSKKRKRKKPVSHLMTSLLTESLLASKARLESLKRLTRRISRREMMRRPIKLLKPII